MKLLICVFLFFIAFAGPVRAESIDLSGAEPFSNEAMIKFLVSQQQFSLEKRQNFDAFMAITACDLYERFSYDDFKWREMHKELSPALTRELESGVDRIFYMDDYVKLARYNFETRSFDLQETSFKSGANILSAINIDTSIDCGPEDGFRNTDLPEVYKFRLNIPVSLFRIPMSKTLADRIIQYTVDNNYDERGLFLRVYIELDSANYEIVESFYGNVTSEDVSIFANIVQIDIFMDHERSQKIKTYRYDF